MFVPAGFIMAFIVTGLIDLNTEVTFFNQDSCWLQ